MIVQLAYEYGNRVGFEKEALFCYLSILDFSREMLSKGTYLLVGKAANEYVFAL